MGLAGWLSRELSVPVWCTQTEWLMATAIYHDAEGNGTARQIDFYREHGLNKDWLETLSGRGNMYRKRISRPPAAYRRIADGEEFEIGGHRWRVIVGTGHAPEHACLWCEALNVLISGDQILPRITPNVSLPAAEPDSDPLADFLKSLSRFEALPGAHLWCCRRMATRSMACTPGSARSATITKSAWKRSSPPATGRNRPPR